MRARRHARGVTLIEGMIATVVLLIGILGSMQAMLMASQQNAIANKMTRASAIARQIRAGLEQAKYTRLIDAASASNFFVAPNCVAGVSVEEFDLPAATCVVDLDARDAQDVLMPGYSPEERRIFDRRLAFYGALADNGGEPAFRSVVVIVSWSQGFGSGSVGYHRQVLGLYNPSGDPAAGNQTGVEL